MPEWGELLILPRYAVSFSYPLKGGRMNSDESVRDRVVRCVGKFARDVGHDSSSLDDDTDLARGLGLSSDEGLDLVLDLCEEFEFEFPKDFNPVVHDTGHRGRRLGELVQRVASLVGKKEFDHAPGE